MKRALVPSLSIAIVLGVVACGGSTPGPDVIYENGATDEAWATIDAATPTVDDDAAPRLVLPDAPVARDGAVPIFTWEGGAVAMSVSREARRPRALEASVFERIARELFPVARAHEPPVTGAMYALTIEAPGAETVHVLTGGTAWTPSADAWAGLSSATEPLTVEIVGTYLVTGNISEGPYVRATPATVELE